MQKDTAGSMKDVADDYTEFNADYSARIEGKQMATRFAEAGNKASSGTEVAAEMGNPKVQVYYGDVAILTYNFMGLSKDK
jgi:phosphopentomutase